MLMEMTIYIDISLDLTLKVIEKFIDMPRLVRTRGQAMEISVK